MEFITLNNNVQCPVIGIGTFMLSPADAENSVRYYHRTDEQLVQFAEWRPEFEKR